MEDTEVPAGRRTPELERLNDSVGRWIAEGEVRAAPSHPAYKFTYLEDVEWLPGGSFLLMHWQYKNPSGEDRGITIMGYDVDEHLYFSHTFDGRGKVNRFKGQLDGDTLVLKRLDPFQRDGSTFVSRYTSQRVSPTRRTFRTEISKDGESWSVTVEGTATKS